MSESRVPLTYCSFASAIPSEARVLLLDGNLTPMEAFARIKAFGLIPTSQCEHIELIAYPVPGEVEDWEYQAYLANRYRLIELDEARALFEAKPISEWDSATHIIEPVVGSGSWTRVGPPLPAPNARLPSSWSRSRRKQWRIKRRRNWTAWWENYPDGAP